MDSRFLSLQRADVNVQMDCDEQGSSIWSALLNNPPCSSVRSFCPSALPSDINITQGVDLGAILSTLSPALSTLEKALHNVRESASVESSHTRIALILQVNLGFTQNSEMCLAFFRRCVDFGEVIAASSVTFVAHPSFSRARASNDLQERVMALGTEAADVPAENATQSQSMSPLKPVTCDS